MAAQAEREEAVPAEEEVEYVEDFQARRQRCEAGPRGRGRAALAELPALALQVLEKLEALGINKGDINKAKNAGGQLGGVRLPLPPRGRRAGPSVSNLRPLPWLLPRRLPHLRVAAHEPKEGGRWGWS